MKKAVFEGLVFDTSGQQLEVNFVGDEPNYVLNDDGFLRHIPAEDVDRQVWEALTGYISGNEEKLSEQAAEMLGQDDLFTVAMIRAQLENKDKQFDALQQNGLPEDARDYLGMTGFRVTVNYHGEVVDVHQPGVVDDNSEE